MSLTSWLALLAFPISLLTFAMNGSQFFIKRYENKRKYANLFFAYVLDHEPASENTEQVTGLIEIVNSNSLPIRDVLIFLTSNRSYGELKDLLIIDNHTSMYYLEIVTPGTTHIKCSLNNSASGGEHDAVAMIFSDVSGNVWFKDTRGKLYKITERHKNKFLASKGLLPPYNLSTKVYIK